MDRTGPRVHVAPTRCPFCHEAVQKGEQPAVCPECHALHHVACLDEAGACAACGRRVASPEDSKLAAALGARASAREKPPEPATTSPPADEGWSALLLPATIVFPPWFLVALSLRIFLDLDVVLASLISLALMAVAVLLWRRR
ncbi:MAG: hypothetical protein KIT58_08900 [Planctomycetota bacterium]|nr:hypothetical protein [Planctomycetota bacterium]